MLVKALLMKQSVRLPLVISNSRSMRRRVSRCLKVATRNVSRDGLSETLFFPSTTDARRTSFWFVAILSS